MAGRVWGTAAVAALVVASTCGSAVAAPPTDPPGKSGEAPGQQKNDASPAEPAPPGQAKKDDDEPQAVVADVAGQPAPAPQQALEPAVPSVSPRFENASGKPKVNVPAAAEAAPETSVSAPGRSGRHKLTICHNGHAITVDVHAARAHVDGHGDTYAVAGAKGRAACPQSSVPAPPSQTPPRETPPGPGAVRTEVSAVVAEATRRAADPAVASSVAEDPPVVPAGGREPTHGVSATEGEQRDAVDSAVAGRTLPFTGAPLETLVLLGFGLVGAGLLLRLLASRRASTRRSRSVRSVLLE